MIVVTQQQVIQQQALPGFPVIVNKLIETIDDPDMNTHLLVKFLAREPVLAGKVFAQANAASTHTARAKRVDNLFTATSLLGLKRLRQIVILGSVANFINDAMPAGFGNALHNHSVAAGICAQILASRCERDEYRALIAGLLHDIGQLWLACHYPERFRAVLKQLQEPTNCVVEIEQQNFGASHAQIGAWLAASWELPEEVCMAIAHHHNPHGHDDDDLVPVVHVAEVLSNGLELFTEGTGRIDYLSGKSCAALGIRWDDSMFSLFGRIESLARCFSKFY